MNETVYVASTATKQLHLVLRLKKAGYPATAETCDSGRLVRVHHSPDEADQVAKVVALIDRGARINQN